MRSSFLEKLQNKTRVGKLDSITLRGDTQSMGFAAFLKEDYYDEAGNR